MPGLDLSQLSSNWKKLQEKLQAEQPKAQAKKSNGLKRKRQDDKGPAVAVKKTKRSAPNPRKPLRRTKMGLLASKTENPEPSDTYQTLTRDHDISQASITQAYGTNAGSTKTPIQYHDEINGGLHRTHKIGRYLALDCEMVGTGAPPYDDHVLARVSLVNFHGEQIYDSYVLPPPGITVHDYRTFVSGIRPEHLSPNYARPYAQVQKDTASLLDNRILVGHAVKNDLNVLLLSHPRRDIRDTSRYKPFRELNHGRPPALRHLARVKLGVVIQGGEHSSVEDARATMMLFRMEKVGFEEENRKLFGVRSFKVAGNGRRGGIGVLLDEEDEGREDDDADEEDQRLVDGVDEDGETNAEVVAVKQPKVVKKKSKKKKRTKRK